eukprot:CAMPEP_0197023018 /NCGR_PEP_ID=MMETSP1384-20130603/3797_1 /TAXON_ID=29189 /ORGANISM="Ammonia sp." /LENGTH=221 /DNA_ID=CAMNT_0042451157 /DNA_START=120 /DNA_END=785 /DNA_ORIENTATION=-
MFASLLCILLVFVNNYVSLAESRTCVCAEFLADECDALANCKWNEVVKTEGETQGTHGVCRSLLWLQCHEDPDCTIASRDPVGDAAASSEDQKMPLAADEEQPGDYGNGETPSEYDDRDWPWDCTTNTDGSVVYATHAINVRPLELAAQTIRNEQILNAASTVSVGKSSLFSLTGLQIVAGISFIVIVIAAFIWNKYQPAWLSQGKSLTTNTDHYSTFTAV